MGLSNVSVNVVSMETEQIVQVYLNWWQLTCMFILRKKDLNRNTY